MNNFSTIQLTQTVKFDHQSRINPTSTKMALSINKNEIKTNFLTIENPRPVS